MTAVTLNGNIVTVNVKPHMIVFQKDQLVGWHLAGDTNTIHILLTTNRFDIKVTNDQNWNEALVQLTELCKK